MTIIQNMILNIRVIFEQILDYSIKIINGVLEKKRKQAAQPHNEE